MLLITIVLRFVDKGREDGTRELDPRDFAVR